MTNTKENDVDQKKLKINQVNSNSSGKTHVKENFNNEVREPPDQDDKKSEREEITEQRNPNVLHKNVLALL